MNILKTSSRVRLKVISKCNVILINFQLIFNFSYCLVIVKLKIRDTELQILSQVEILAYTYQKKENYLIHRLQFKLKICIKFNSLEYS